MMLHQNKSVSLKDQSIRKSLIDIYNQLMDCYGPQHWWPAEEPFEVMVGAVLTQSTAWRNVEKAINSLKKEGVLSPLALRCLSLPEIANLIHSCGYYNVKARRLKSLVDWLGECCGDDLNILFESDTVWLRNQLLSIYGIGEETADSIILYAIGKPVFVIDAYTHRIINRIGLTPHNNTYSAYQALFMGNLEANVRWFNEYHALLVCLGKNVCRKQPLCFKCCLLDICSHGNNR